MTEEQVAWEYLTPIEKAQLLHCRPNLRQEEEEDE